MSGLLKGRIEMPVFRKAGSPKNSVLKKARSTKMSGSEKLRILRKMSGFKKGRIDKNVRI